jgi:hypothetical protein
MKKPRSPEMEKAAVAWKLVEKLDEQRRYPRLALDIPVAFRNASGQHCAAKLVNVGPGGIQIRCNTATAQILHPNGGKISPDNSSIVQIAIAIPLSTGAVTLSAGGSLTYLTTVPDDPRCVMGINFLDLRPKAQHIVDQFFDEKLYEHFDGGEVLESVRRTA